MGNLSETPARSPPYRERGRGPDLVLLHELTDSAREWAAVSELLEGRFHSICPELPLSPAAGGGENGPLDVPRQTAALGEWLDSLGVPEFFVAGIGWGGFLALEMALTRPDRVRGLVLIGTAAHLDRYTRSVMAAWFDAVEKGGSSGYVDRYMRDVLHPDYLMDHLEDLPRLRADFAGKGVMRAKPSFEGACSYDARRRIASIRSRTLVIHGMEDRVFDTTHARILRQTIPGAAMRLFPNAGHDLPREKAEDLQKLLGEFHESIT
jgi:pimeloyl-ACP methyl ester carboxylesterase